MPEACPRNADANRARSGVRRDLGCHADVEGSKAGGMDIRPILKSQYHAALAMLGQAVRSCPDDLWTDKAYQNAFWHIAYHTLFFTHLYLQKDGDAFVPWERHREEYQFFDNLPWPPHRMPNIGKPYTKDDVLEYWSFCDAMVDSAVSQLDLDAAECGFSWYKMSKLEHQLNNIRHIQHHTAQLSDRLRAKAGVGVAWV
jgi:hypothetical protein